MFESLFSLSIPILEKILRPALVYIFLVVLLRIFGKRELAQLNPFDLIVLLCLSNTVQNAIIGNDNSVTGGLIGAFTLLGINYVTVRYLFRHRGLEELMAGKPTVLIEHGQIKQEALDREQISPSELMMALHRQGFSSVEGVDSFVLEPGGDFSITAKEPRAEERRHDELTAGISALRSEIQDLRRQLGARS